MIEYRATGYLVDFALVLDISLMQDKIADKDKYKIKYNNIKIIKCKSLRGKYKMSKEINKSNNRNLRNLQKQFI